MKCTLRHIEGDRWTVMDADDLSMHSGTLRECEDWLDHQENRERESLSLFARLSRWFRRIFRRDLEDSQPSGESEGSGNAAVAERPSAGSRTQKEFQQKGIPPTDPK